MGQALRKKYLKPAHENPNAFSAELPLVFLVFLLSLA